MKKKGNTSFKNVLRFYERFKLNQPHNFFYPVYFRLSFILLSTLYLSNHLSISSILFIIV